MFPSLLSFNPRAKIVFENLRFFANPQVIPRRAVKIEDSSIAMKRYKLRTLRRRLVTPRSKKSSLSDLLSL